MLLILIQFLLLTRKKIAPYCEVCEYDSRQKSVFICFYLSSTDCANIQLVAHSTFY